MDFWGSERERPINFIGQLTQLQRNKVGESFSCSPPIPVYLLSYGNWNWGVFLVTLSWGKWWRTIYYCIEQLNRSVIIISIYFTCLPGLALKCWRCSSDSTNAAFCGDPFDPSILTEQQRRWSYVDCTFPPNQINPYQTTQTRPVCKKMKQKGEYLELSVNYFHLLIHSFSFQCTTRSSCPDPASGKTSTLHQTRVNAPPPPPSSRPNFARHAPPMAATEPPLKPFPRSCSWALRP